MVYHGDDELQTGSQWYSSRDVKMSNAWLDGHEKKMSKEQFNREASYVSCATLANK